MGLYLEERFNGGFLTLPVWGAYIILEGLIHGGAYFRKFTVFWGRGLTRGLWCNFSLKVLSYFIKKFT